jgi:cytochrome c biogenesis protein
MHSIDNIFTRSARGSRREERGYLLNFLNRVWDFFTSVKLTVVVLVSLGATSIIGTVIPQNKDAAVYVREYGEFLYRIFTVFDIFDMYHSWWYQCLILLLTINIIICSINRLSATRKILFVKNPPFHISRFRNSKLKEEFTDNRSTEQLIDMYEPVISRRFAYSRVDNTEMGRVIFAEKWRWTRLGVYVIHMSVVLLLFGALIGSVFGIEGFVNIPEGEVINSIRTLNNGKIHNLDFEIRCDDFNVSFYDTGAPKEYRSSLTILEKGKPILKKEIIVNDPLRYKGINLFQSSYGTLPPNKLTLTFKSNATGKVFKKMAMIGKQIDIPEGMGTFTLQAYRKSADYGGHNIGEAFTGILTQDHRNPVFVLLPLRFPSFDKMRKGDVVISVTEYDKRYFTGLMVTKDPGVWIVYSGFILMIIGFFITCFMSHQQLCIEVIKGGEKSRVMVTGTANKNKLGMQRKVKRISETLANLS